MKNKLAWYQALLLAILFSLFMGMVPNSETTGGDCVRCHEK